MMRLANLAALVMHVRPYRESSAMVRFFTREQGVLVVVARGIRKGKNANQMQPFSYGNLSCSGRGNLMTLTQYERMGQFDLRGDQLSAGFYVLELLDRCLIERQVEAPIFDGVQVVLKALQDKAPMAIALRKFETQLLEQLGYGIDYAHDTEGNAIGNEQDYVWQPERGFALRTPSAAIDREELPISGRLVGSIAKQDYSDPEAMAIAKHINQRALQPLLGSKPLVSRSLYRAGKGVGQQHG